jgi:hypothetical protein
VNDQLKRCDSCHRPRDNAEELRLCPICGTERRLKGYPAVRFTFDSSNHKPNWHAHLGYIDRGQGSEGLTVSVYITEPDAYDHNKPRSVVHYFPVPPAAYDYRSWRRWLFNQLGLVDDHERMEHFTIAGEKPYAPDHKPGRDPYTVVERGTWEDADTSFRGERNHPETEVGNR